MPSITKTALDDLTSRIATAEARAENERLEKIALRSKVAAFDDILDKIGRAANGLPLTDERNAGLGSTYYGYGNMGIGQTDQRLTDAEREAIEQARLHERIVALESRLAAVIAVAQFAKGHKA